MVKKVFFTYVEPKHQSDSHNQAGANDFQPWFGYFEYVGYLLHGLTLIVLNSCLDLIAINFIWSTWPWSSVQREISSTKLCKPLLIRSISLSTFSVHCTNLFLRFGCVFTFLEIIKHNMPKMLLFSSIFNIKRLHKNSPTLISLFLNAHGYDSCHIQSNKTVSNEVKDN